LAHSIAIPGSRGTVAPWGLGTSIAALVGSFGGFYIGAIILLQFTYSIYQHDQLAFGVMSEQFLVVSVAAIAFYLGWVRYNVRAEGLGFRFSGWTPLLVAVAIIPLIFVGIALISAFFSTVLPGYHLEGNARQTLVGNGEHVGTGERVVAFIWASVEAPLAEETLFRGIIYQGLRHFFTRWLAPGGSIAAGALVSGIAFGLVHFEPHTLPILAFVGVVLALIFEYARSVYASFLVHGIFNFLAVLYVFH
jgi:membrane protease YdiL (CAAX protease family)